MVKTKIISKSPHHPKHREGSPSQMEELVSCAFKDCAARKSRAALGMTWGFAIIMLISLVGFNINSYAATPVSPDMQQALAQLEQLQKKMPARNTIASQPTKADPPPSQAASIPATPTQQPAVPPPATTTTTTTTTTPTATPDNTVPLEALPPTVEVTPPIKRSRADAMFGGDPEVDEGAFRSVTSKMFPLNPSQILRLRKMYNTIELAKTASPDTPPRPTATSQIVNLAPGSTPPVIRLAQGFVSSLVFLDSTGAPWPIEAYDLGDPKSFNIQWDRTSNTLMIQANKLYTYGNLAIKLIGLNTPVMLTLIPGQKAVDYRVDMRVQGFGPNAKAIPVGLGIPLGANSLLLKVLDGVAPDGSVRLKVIGGDAEAWALGNKLFIRTRLTILSPGWIATMTSADGTHAYEMLKAPVLLVSWRGKVMQLKIEGI